MPKSLDGKQQLEVCFPAVEGLRFVRELEKASAGNTYGCQPKPGFPGTPEVKEGR